MKTEQTAINLLIYLPTLIDSQGSPNLIIFSNRVKRDDTKLKKKFTIATDDSKLLTNTKHVAYKNSNIVNNILQENSTNPITLALLSSGKNMKIILMKNWINSGKFTQFMDHKHLLDFIQNKKNIA
jgi:hypothetical protein